MVNNALSVLPTRPLRYIVPLIVLGVLFFYYQEQYSKCTDSKQFRVSLNNSLLSKSPGETFSLVDFTEFSWDKVRIVTNVKPGERNVECPFGWNWEKGQREALMSEGLLTVLMFGHGESIVGYAELRNDEVGFSGVESSLTPQSAVFRIVTNTDSSGVLLNLKN